MKKIAESLLKNLKKTENDIKKNAMLADEKYSVYPASIHKLGECVVAVGRDDAARFVMVVADYPKALPEGFDGEKSMLVDGGALLVGKLNAANAKALRKYFPWTAPVSLRERRSTVGCGDRLGLASRGHILAAAKYKVSPVLAQQSMRELSLTGRTFQNVVDDAVFMVYESDYRDGFGADGDHLKKIADIDVALSAGMPMITLDLSEVMNAAAADWSEKEIQTAFEALPDEVKKRVIAEYEGKTFIVGSSKVVFDGDCARRCAVMYTKALDFALEVYQFLKSKRGNEFDLEISIDETSAPTLPSHHLFITRELRKRHVEFSSLAPRFIGEFQKAIDYIGDLAEFDRQFKVHAEIAANYGNYKISVHSGSDKFAVYPTIGRETKGYLHLKTAGTSWLVAVTVIAQKNPQLYREMHQLALDHFGEMLKLYHITADLSKIPALPTLADAELPKLMDMPEARQLLHITYGPILKSHLRDRFFHALFVEEDAYTQAIEKHFDKHLSLLNLEKK